MNEFVQYRREFHKYPENGWSEIRTSARIAEILTYREFQMNGLSSEQSRCHPSAVLSGSLRRFL